jgi:hypothetical protein
MATTKLRYNGHEYILDAEKLDEFTETLEQALLSDKPQLVDVPVTGGKSARIAVSIHSQLAIEQSAPSTGQGRRGRRGGSVIVS